MPIQFSSSNATRLRGRVISTTTPSNGDTLIWNSGTSLWTPGVATTTPGGSDTQVQFNDGGVFGGADIYYNNSSGSVSIGTSGGSRFSVRSIASPSTLFKMTTFGAHEIFSISEDGSGFSAFGFGDLDEAQNQTRFSLYDATKVIKFQTLGSVYLGDIDGYGNASNLVIDVTNNIAYFQNNNVAIGAAAAAGKLHIQGDDSGKTLVLRHGATSPLNQLEFQSSTGVLYSYFGATGNLYINNPTGFTPAANLVIKDGGDSTPAIEVLSNVNKDIFLVSQVSGHYPYIWMGDTTGTKNLTNIYLSDYDKQLFLYSSGITTLGDIQGGAGTGIYVDGINEVLYLHGTSVVAESSITANTFVSMQDTGTAPFTVASTTLVTNLNADLIDDLDSTAFPILAPASSTRNVIQPTNATFIPLKIKGFTSQSANLLEFQSSTGTIYTSFSATGKMVANQTANATSYYIQDLNLTADTSTFSNHAAINIYALQNHASGAANSLYGVRIKVQTNYSVSGTSLTTMWGSYIENYHFATRALGQNYVQELFSRVDANRGGITTNHILRLNGSHGANTTIGTHYGILFENTGAGGNVTSYYNMYIKALTGAATVTNQYGIYLENINKGGTIASAITTNAGNIVFNEGGDANTDIRFEGDNDQYNFFLDASADSLGIGVSVVNAKLHVQGKASGITSIFQANATTPGNISEWRNSSAAILNSFDAVGGAVFNEQGGATGDFRIEGDTDANLFYADYSADTVQIGATTTSDSAKFYVSGKISASGEVEINGDLNHDGSNVGLYGTAPVAQATTAGAAATFVANTSGIANDTATFDGYTIGQVVKALRNIGALA